MTAFGAIRALTRAGIRVPEQCSVIGFDDVSPAAICTPALTTIRQPMEMMGQLAVEIIVDAMRTVQEKSSAKAVHRKVAPELVARESTHSLQ
jgi:LacI family transcriptional regulator